MPNCLATDAVAKPSTLTRFKTLGDSRNVNAHEEDAGVERHNAVLQRTLTKASSLLSWICKDADEAWRVAHAYSTVEKCKVLVAQDTTRSTLLKQIFGSLPGGSMAFRLNRLPDGKYAVRSADLLYTVHLDEWNAICSPPLTNQEKKRKAIFVSDSAAYCPLCYEEQDSLEAARAHLLSACLRRLAVVTDPPILF